MFDRHLVFGYRIYKWLNVCAAVVVDLGISVT